jgi:hypothetical protein
MRALIRGLRLLIVPAIWLAFVPYAIAAGRNPGFVPPSYAGPYPTGHVIAVCLLLAIESLVFFVMLQPLTYELRDRRRPLKVLAICLLALFLESVFMYTDMPGYVYVNAAFLFAWCLVTFSLVVVGLVISKVSPSPTSNSSKHAA